MGNKSPRNLDKVTDVKPSTATFYVPVQNASSSEVEAVEVNNLPYHQKGNNIFIPNTKTIVIQHPNNAESTSGEIEALDRPLNLIVTDDVNDPFTDQVMLNGIYQYNGLGQDRLLLSSYTRIDAYTTT